MKKDSEEVCAVVDEEDKVLGEAPRSILHDGGKLIHRAVHVFVVNDKGEIAVQKRSRKKDLYAGLYGSSASGHVEAEETYLKAALRELSEELPNVSGRLTRVAKFLVETEFEREQSVLYVCRFSGRIEFESEEAEAVEYMSLMEIEEKRKKGILAPAFEKALDEYKRCCAKSRFKSYIYRQESNKLVQILNKFCLT
jgi:isopentenyldiphosphate isomerase